MKKYWITFGLLGTLTFLGLFVYFYKTSGKFRKSIIAAFVAATFYFSGLTPAHSAGEADAAFTQQNQQHQSRIQRPRGIFGRELNNDGSGPEKPDSESEEDQCPIDQQNKAGIHELPDSSKFIYNLETKTTKKALKKAWKNPKAKKEILANLDKMNSGELLPRNEKDFKGFKTLKELKFTKTRMLVSPGKNGKPDEIIAIFLRRDLDDIAKKLKNKFD